jgi:hypothetical protein
VWCQEENNELENDTFGVCPEKVNRDVEAEKNLR